MLPAWALVESIWVAVAANVQHIRDIPCSPCTAGSVCADGVSRAHHVISGGRWSQRHCQVHQCTDYFHLHVCTRPHSKVRTHKELKSKRTATTEQSRRARLTKPGSLSYRAEINMPNAAAPSSTCVLQAGMRRGGWLASTPPNIFWFSGFEFFAPKREEKS